MMTDSELMRVSDGSVESSEGWAVRAFGAEWIEYCSGAASCLINIDYQPARRERRIHASASVSELFPDMRDHLRRAAPLLPGHYVVV